MILYPPLATVERPWIHLRKAILWNTLRGKLHAFSLEFDQSALRTATEGREWLSNFVTMLTHSQRVIIHFPRLAYQICTYR
jgi:hypothetical protein